MWVMGSRWRFVPFYVALLGVTLFACFKLPTGSRDWWVALVLLLVQGCLVVAQLRRDGLFDRWEAGRRRSTRDRRRNSEEDRY
jgi:hypothetical protein